MKMLISASITLSLLAGTAMAGPSGYPYQQNQSDPWNTNSGQHSDAVQRQTWFRGDRLPDKYRGSRHAVADWRRRGLSSPEPGYQWVRVNDQYFLVSTGSGRIAEMIPVRHHGR